MSDVKYLLIVSISIGAKRLVKLQIIYHKKREEHPAQT